MSHHVQGLILFGALALATLVVARIAAPAVGDAFSSDGAVSSTSIDDITDAAAEDGSEDEALTDLQLQATQYYLLFEGYDVQSIDGIMGPITREAMDSAKEALLDVGTNASDRDLYNYLCTTWEPDQTRCASDVATEADAEGETDADTADAAVPG